MSTTFDGPVPPIETDARSLAENLGQDIVIIVTISPDGEVEAASWGGRRITSQVAGILADTCRSEVMRRALGHYR